jgi:hypothetical protein
MQSQKTPPLAYQVLAHCARAEVDPALTHQLARLLSEFSGWEEISAQAEMHGLGPLLYVHSKATGTPLSPTVNRELQGLYLRHRQANRLRTGVLREVLAAFSAAGIQALVLKGAALSHLVYPEPGLRPMSDVDLLVRKAEARHALSLLVGLGFSASPPGNGPLPEKSLAKAVLVTEGLPVSLDIHHDLCEGFDPLSLTMDELVDTPLPFSLGGTTAYTLGHAEMLWHLCRHLIIHGIGNPLRFIWLADVVGFAERFQNDIDWNSVRRHYPMVLNTVSLLHSVTPLSEALLTRAAINPSRPPRGIPFDFEARPEIRVAHWRRAGYTRALRQAFFPSELWLRMYYVLDSPRWLFWYRWVRHPLEMVRLFGPRLLRRVRRRISM